jgi:PP-loop family
MAASRTRPKKADPLESLLLEAVGSALQRAQERLDALDPRGEEPLRRKPARRPPLYPMTAYSGGRDSTALLHVMARLAAQRGSGLHEVVAVHIHHGISRYADEWLFHCEREAAALGLRFIGRRVTVKRAAR